MRLKLITISISAILASFCAASIAQAQAVPFFGEAENICELIKNIFYFGVSLAGIAAMLVIMIGGIIYMVSFGSEEKKKMAMDLMGGALKGLLLALFSWTIFYIINPYLLKCKVPVLEVELPEWAPAGPVDPCMGRTTYETQEKCEQAEAKCDSGGTRCIDRRSPGCTNPEKCMANSDCCPGYYCGDFSDGGIVGPVFGKCKTDNKFWCCPGDCTEVASQYGWKIQQPNDREGLTRGGLINRKKPPPSPNWCYNGNPSGAPSVLEGVSDPIQISSRICPLLSAVKAAGFSPVVTCIVGGHSRCTGSVGSASCHLPLPDGCNESPHWRGCAVDLAYSSVSSSTCCHGGKCYPDEYCRLQEWLFRRENRTRLHIFELIGPIDGKGGKGTQWPFPWSPGMLRLHDNHIHITIGGY